MFRIGNNGIVTVNRGDSFDLPVTLQTGTALQPQVYELQENDCLYLGIMEPNQPFEVAIVRKKLTYDDVYDTGSIVFNFTPNDTLCLLPGKYYYQVKLTSTDPDNTCIKHVETIIDKTLFYIQE